MLQIGRRSHIMIVTEPTTHKAATHCGPRWDFLYLGGCSMAELKKPLSYEGQLKRLKVDHNLKIDNDDAATKILKRVNYYRLSAYGLGLMQEDDKEKYRDGITLEHIFRLYTFDSRLRSILFPAIEKLEIQLRAQISNHLAMTYGAGGYTYPSNFTNKATKDGKTVHEKIMEDFRREINHQVNAPFVRHHMERYEGRFPAWVAVELFTFGNLASIYSIMKPDDRKAIAGLYNTDPKYLGSWMLSLVEIRNICAHYGRLYNMPLKQAPALYREHRIYRQEGKATKLFQALLAMKRVFDSDARWKSVKTELEALIEEYADVVNLSFIDFPKNWKDVL